MSECPKVFIRNAVYAGKEYQLVPVHMFGVPLDVLLKNIGIKAAKGSFVGKEVEFIKEEQ